MNRYDAITDTVSTLNMINYQVAELLRIKEELDTKLNTLLQHPEEGQKTYTHEKYKIIVKTGFNYSLNKEEYESVGNRLPAQFNPVKERIAYDLDKKIIRDAEKYASLQDLEILSSVISKKPSKLSVRIIAGV